MFLSRNSYPKLIDSLPFSDSLERTAAEIPDGVAKLRFLRGSIGRHNRRARRWQIGGACSCAILIAIGAASIPRPDAAVHPKKDSAKAAASVSKMAISGPVWLVERNSKVSIYSNGLHVWNDFQTDGPPRQFRPLTRENLELAAPRTKPAGIVYHTSESLMAPFEPHRNESLKRYGLGLLGSAVQNRSYHFVIDRFGRVFRVVPETQVANHAGHSVWADSKFVYVNLNQSFIGISFEAQTGNADARIGDAQIHSGRVLTDMLRAEYDIPEEDCVTHAQVSVNPSKMFIGYHTDWASHFPFEGIGLPNEYDRPVAGVGIFGFRYDPTFLQAIGGTPWNGLISAEQQLIREAAAHGLTPDAYRKTLQKKYKDTVEGLHNAAAAEEKEHEQS